MNMVAMVFQDALHQPAQGGLVFHQENRLGSPRHLWGRSGQRPSGNFPGQTREINVEGGSLVHLALNLNPSLMLFDDAKHRGQPPTGSFAGLLGCKEGFKEVGQMLRYDAGTGVGDGEADKFTGPGSVFSE